MSDLNLQIRSVYNFEVYPVPILGNNFKGVTVLALMDRETAAKEMDPQAMHINVYPYLPAGTPNDPNGYDYVKIKTTANIVTILGLAWIKPESVQLVSSQTVTVKIGNVSANDIPRIRNALVQNGYNALDLSIS